MTRILLIYPYFKPKYGRSSFPWFPPLGLGYLASCLINCGYHPQLLDCTFLDRKKAWQIARESKADIVGIYSMAFMREDSLTFARVMRNHCDLLVAGGPLPSCSPATFLDDFDLVAVGEGEQTILDIVKAHEVGSNFDSIRGLQYRQRGKTIQTAKRELQFNLDQIPFPARDLFPNQEYIDNWKNKFGYSTTTVITTRGCPFNCEFCSNAVFGATYRERSPKNVLDEIEQALALGYDRIYFVDDVFTLNRKRMIQICKGIVERGLEFKWECMGRADSIDTATSKIMKNSGCNKIYFGIESGDESILILMNKRIVLDQARVAVESAKKAGLETGAFFILCYPGETDHTVLKTIKYAVSLPLDDVSFIMPYPLPGTKLFERTSCMMQKRDRTSKLINHSTLYKSQFSEAKMRFAILKGQIQFDLQRRSDFRSSLVKRPFEILTDYLFKIM